MFCNSARSLRPSVVGRSRSGAGPERCPPFRPMLSEEGTPNERRRGGIAACGRHLLRSRQSGSAGRQRQGRISTSTSSTWASCHPICRGVDRQRGLRGTSASFEYFRQPLSRGSSGGLVLIPEAAMIVTSCERYFLIPRSNAAPLNLTFTHVGTPVSLDGIGDLLLSADRAPGAPPGLPTAKSRQPRRRPAKPPGHRAAPACFVSTERSAAIPPRAVIARRS